MNVQEGSSLHRIALQEQQYSFPYHHLTYSQNGVWHPGRSLWWGYEYRALVETIAGIVLSLHPKRVLDFGCGDGALACELSARGKCEVVGVDISERALLYARAFNWGRNVRFVTTLDELPKAYFDCAVAMEVFEHLSERDLATIVALIAERLVKHGKLVVSVPTVNIPLQPKHYRHYDLSLLQGQLADYFECREVRYIHKKGVIGKVVRSVVVNRFFTLTSRHLLRLTTHIYKRFVQQASEKNGHRLVALFERKGY